MRSRWRGTLNGALVLVTAGALTGVPVGAALAAPGTFNVRDFGATGNGSTFDTTPSTGRSTPRRPTAGAARSCSRPGRTGPHDPPARATSRSSSTAAPRSSRRPAASTRPSRTPSGTTTRTTGTATSATRCSSARTSPNLAITGTGTFDGDGLTTDDNVPYGPGRQDPVTEALHQPADPGRQRSAGAGTSPCCSTAATASRSTTRQGSAPDPTTGTAVNIINSPEHRHHQLGDRGRATTRWASRATTRSGRRSSTRTSG